MLMKMEKDGGSETEDYNNYQAPGHTPAGLHGPRRSRGGHGPVRPQGPIWTSSPSLHELVSQVPIFFCKASRRC